MVSCVMREEDATKIKKNQKKMIEIKMRVTNNNPTHFAQDWHSGVTAGECSVVNRSRKMAMGSTPSRASLAFSLLAPLSVA
jgi:thiamine monophosphate kinase